MSKQPRNLNAVFGRLRRRMLAAELSTEASEPARRTMPATPPRPAATPASPGAWRVRSRWSRGRHAPSPPRPLKSSGRGAAGLPSGTVVPTAPPTPEKTTMASNTEKTSPPAFGEGLATHRHLHRPGARPPGARSDDGRVGDAAQRRGTPANC